MNNNYDQSQPITPVILCGGSGSRLWPVSRKTMPKQFIRLVGENSLFQETLHWTQKYERLSDPLVISGESFRFLVEEQLEEINCDNASVILEPMARNTAPAIALAALHLRKNDPNALMLVMPSDHVFGDEQAFESAFSQAAKAAQNGYLATFGLEAKYPETGFGYIKQAERLDYGNDVYQVGRFVEKPDIDRAESYLLQGGFHWNSGMFLFSAGRFIAELEKHHPGLLGLCRNAMTEAEKSDNTWLPNGEIFSQCQDISIDYAVMEKSNDSVVVASRFVWSDVGSWNAIADLAQPDEKGNSSNNQALQLDCNNTYVHGNERLVATVGLDNVVVVDSPDALLVVAKDRVQDVKSVVSQLRDEERQEGDTHQMVKRPWGTFEGVHEGDHGQIKHQVKHITVKPGARLSTQYHHHRAEHWIIVSGTANVTVGKEIKTLKENQNVYIPTGAIHRLHNPTDKTLHLIEVQYGSYLGEDDIVRLDDDYGRTDQEMHAHYKSAAE